MRPKRKRVDGWGVLLLAAVFMVGGIALLLHHGAAGVNETRGLGIDEPGAEYHESVAVSVGHFAGGAGVFLGCALVYFYFKVRREGGVG